MSGPPPPDPTLYMALPPPPPPVLAPPPPPPVAQEDDSESPWPRDARLYRGLDIETYKFRPGEMAPPAVCASGSWVTEAGDIEATLIVGRADVQRFFTEWLGGPFIGVFANAAYDLLVTAQRAFETLSEAEYLAFMKAIRSAIRGGRVFDILLAQALNDIARGHHGKNPDGSDFRDKSGKVTDRYSLDVVTRTVLRRSDAKDNDDFRESFSLLDGIEASRWPDRARIYPCDDVRNQLAVGLAQVIGAPSHHQWISDHKGDLVCKHCRTLYSVEKRADLCASSPRVPHKNLGNLAFQVEANFVLSFNAYHGLRTDPELVEKLAAEAEEKHRVAVARFHKKGWVREDGSEDQAAVKRAIVQAYLNGVEVGACLKCGGSGKVPSIKVVPCRGVKGQNRRFQGCQGPTCGTCAGRLTVDKVEGDKICRVDESGEGCDGTGYNLAHPAAQVVARADKGGIKADRDVKMESGDEDLSDYGEDEFEKTRTTYVPYLRKGTRGPLPYNVDSLKVTGRLTVDGTLFQMPRQGGERRTIRARGAWCGYPHEMVLSSTDYSAGELCTLGQLNYFLFGYSQMRDAINKSKNPGILHSDMASYVLGISLDEFMVRLKGGDKVAKEFRQAMKPILFGKGGGMGDPKLVMTNRKKNAGFTVSEYGPAKNGKGEPGYWGIRFCILVGGRKTCGDLKINRWKNYDCAPVCKACVDVVANELSPAYFRRYSEMREYHKWVGKKIDRREPAPTLVWDADANAIRIVRERACDQFSEFANNGFQSMLAEIMKHAYTRASWECILGETEDGRPSPLYGCRLPIVMHDEPLGELFRDTAHLSGPRIADLMMESGRMLAPDVYWLAETAIATHYSKEMEPVYETINGEKQLTLWTPGK